MGGETHVLFDQVGDFQAMHACKAFLAGAGASMGSWQRGAPAGVMLGDCHIAKWRNLSAQDRRALHGRVEGNGREGPLTLVVTDPAARSAIAKATGGASPSDGEG